MDLDLLLQPWRSIAFGNSKFLAKICFSETGYALLISDLTGVWHEEVDASIVQVRSKELNKRLKAPVCSFLKHLSELLQPLLLGGQTDHSSASFSCQRNDSKLNIHVKSELSDLPFHWGFYCGEASGSLVSRHLLQPLMRMNLALEHQSQQLMALLLQKDLEIQDYRESGAMLSRGRLETEVFDEKCFLEKFLCKSLPDVCRGGNGMAFTGSLQHLYTAVLLQEVKHQLSGDEKRGVSSSSLQEEQVEERGLQTSSDALPLAPAIQGSGEAASIPPVCAKSRSQNASLSISKAKKKKAKGLFG
uniref:Non-homologous end-joining factor 1 n=1 Tax=Geotrypetes seraphini TaxID=260995 RepID=A0A6P8QZW7_GEOSA|nr:non-homologous end-joining factor 1 [Geotrypetes seraphini]XP_033803026.1 non-homologous end-joining factor 1 [Geotrypetes seraphini]XP_033803027.1 non-homologous end-joining factor 1 [Geotrypetes seraphini]